jgi:alpha-tubulin suppressor-like RCC1 family protein
MMVEKDGKQELWSAGHNSTGLLGQGEGVNDSNVFKPMHYDTENITFVDASIKYEFGMAVTDKGELYGWGVNSQKQLGMSETKNYHVPTEIPFFKDYYVHKFSVGECHAIIVASNRSDRETKHVYATGYIQGINTDGQGDDGILELKQYRNVEIDRIETGER